MKCIAVDWSGSDEEGQLAHIWLAIAEASGLVRLMNGLTRDEAVSMLVGEIKLGDPVVIGLDFAFSFPERYLVREGIQNARGLWDRAEQQGEEWLNGQTWPFWGRKGPYRKRPQDLVETMQFRETDRAHGAQSVFKIYTAGAVGTGTVRGLPLLARLKDAGAAIWPFDPPNPGGATVVEIYPRVFYGHGVTNNARVNGRDSRRAYLGAEYPGLERHWRDVMVGSGDAFDAGVSALVMSANAGNLRTLAPAHQRPQSVEGQIWLPY